MTPNSRLRRRVAVTGATGFFLLSVCVLCLLRVGRLEASPLDQLRAWWDGRQAPSPCDGGACPCDGGGPPCDKGWCGEGVDGEWYWVRSPEQEKRTVISLYNRYCIRCHGVDGRGVWDIPDVPDFTNARWQAIHSDGQLARSILEGRGAVMPPFRGTLTLEEAWAVGRYLRTFVPGTETPRPDVGKLETPATPEKPPMKTGP